CRPTVIGCGPLCPSTVEHFSPILGTVKVETMPGRVGRDGGEATGSAVFARLGPRRGPRGRGAPAPPPPRPGRALALVYQHRHAVAAGHDAEVVGGWLADHVHHGPRLLVAGQQAPDPFPDREPDASLNAQRGRDDDVLGACLRPETRLHRRLPGPAR